MSTKETLRQAAGTVEGNSVRIDTKQVIEALNTDLTTTYVLSHQLRKHHWNVAGAESDQLHDWFGDAAENAEDDVHEIEHSLDDDTLVLEAAIH